MNYYSVLNRFTVYDLESFYPAIKTLQEVLDDYTARVPKTSKADVYFNVSLFVERELQSPTSTITNAVRNFYETANRRIAFSEPPRRKLTESAKVFPAVVALNVLYDAIHLRKNVDDAVASLYMKHLFFDIILYVDSQRNYNNNNNTVSLESLHSLHSNNDPYGFGEMEVKKTRRRTRRTKRY